MYNHALSQIIDSEGLEPVNENTWSGDQSHLGKIICVTENNDIIYEHGVHDHVVTELDAAYEVIEKAYLIAEKHLRRDYQPKLKDMVFTIRDAITECMSKVEIAKSDAADLHYTETLTHDELDDQVDCQRADDDYNCFRDMEV